MKKTIEYSHSKKLLLVGMMICMGLFLANFVVAIDWTNGLVSYYKFDENTGTNASDQLNINHGVTNADWDTGKMGYALKYDGAADYTNLSNSSTLAIANNMTISYWMYMNATGTGQGRTISKDNKYFNIWTHSSGDGYWATDNGTVTNTGTTTGNISGGWHFVVVGQNDTHHYIFIDGSLNKAASKLAGIVTSIDHLYLGANGGSSEFYKGLIDEMAIWNRTLGTDEILQLYNGGGGLGYNAFPLINNQNYNTSDYETSSQFFSINISNVTLGYTSASASFYYNGTSYTTYKTTGETSYVFNSTVPNVGLAGTKDFLWNFTLTNVTGTYYLNSTATQTVNNLNFALCNSTANVSLINVTFKDESTLGVLNATISSSTFSYTLGTWASNLTYSLISATENYNYTFCSNVNRTITIDPYVQYASTGYPQRIWNPSATDYTNPLTSQILYLLGTSDGLYVSFQLVNPSNQVLSDVSVTATRSIGGEDVIVGQGTTGGDGIVTFWLNPDYSHTITFEKSGFTTVTETITPTQTTYTVTMGGGTAQEIADYLQGMTIYIKPEATTTLYNSTIYNFNMSITTSYWDLDAFGILLRLNNGTFLNSSSSTGSSGGTVNAQINTSDYKRIFMIYYFTVNGTNITQTTSWNVINSWNTDSEWSIKAFFEDFTAYLDTEVFGLDAFGKNLIIYLILFISIGIMSYKFGLTSPISISFMVLMIVYTLDIALGLLTSPIGAIPNVYTWLAGLIFVVLLIREVTRG